MDLDVVRYDDVVHRIYAAALDPIRWPDALKGIAEACEGARCAMFTPLHSPAQGGFGLTCNVPATVVERWANTRRIEDPFANAVCSHGLFLDGAVWFGEDLVSHADLVRTAFYRDLFEPMDVTHICTGVVFDAVDAPKIPTAITVYRSQREGPFAARLLETLRRLLLHVARALGVMFHLRDSQFQLAATHAALDRLSAGVVLLNRWGGVQFCNTAALRQRQAQDMLLLQTGDPGHGGDRLALAPRLQGHAAEFQHALRDALLPLAAVPGHFSNAVLLPDVHGKPICVVHAAPLGQASALAAGSTAPRRSCFYTT